MAEENIIYGKPSINLPNITLGEYIIDKLRKNPLRIIQVDAETGNVLTSHELLEKSVKLAKALEERGIKPGDTIAISSESHPNWFIAACATIFRGACVAPLNPSYLEGEILHALNISRPRMIFVSSRTESIMHEVTKTVPWNIELVQFEDASETEEIVTLKSIIEASKEWPDPYLYQIQAVTRPSEKEVVILCSSGTTGLPKGVMLSNRNILAVIHALWSPEFLGLHDNSVALFLLPFFHGYGFATMLLIIAAGATAIVLPSFDPTLFCEAIQKYRVTIIPLVPPVMVFLAKHPMILQFDFSSIKEIICGAAPLSREIRDAVQKRLGSRVAIRNGYGMTELSVCVTMSPPQTEKTESIGYLTPGTQCKVVDPETSKALEAYRSGELCFKGDHVMLGYRGDPEATTRTIDENGWLHSGDLGHYDQDGHLFISGRLKELIKYKGFQISPAEIENHLLTHSDVIDAAVVGRDDEISGQVPVAFVVRKPGSTVSADQLRCYVDERVSVQKKLRGGVRFIEDIPKNPGGKILRRELEKLISKL